MLGTQRGSSLTSKLSLSLVVLLVVLASIVAVPSVAYARPGELDMTFGDDGKLLTHFTRGEDFASSVVIQEDGKIVVAGRAGARGGSGGRFGLARYNPDGSLDPTFGGDGKVVTDFTPRDDFAQDVAIQADGKIVAAGFAGTCCSGPGGAGSLGIARYNADGSPDTAFGGDGSVMTNLTRGNDFAAGLAIQADGRVVVGGRAGRFGGRFALARYRSDGIADRSFGRDGRVMIDFTEGNDFAAGLGIQADGRIVSAGPAGGAFGIVRVRRNGTLDPTFSGDGRARTDLTPSADGAWTLALQANGKPVAAGYAGGRGGRFALVRYNRNGTRDRSFGGDGTVVTNFTPFDDYASKLVIQTDGKLVAVGAANAVFALARYGTNGDLDPAFGTRGKITTFVSAGGDFASGAAIQADEKIVAVGLGNNLQSDRAFAAVRYLAE